MPKPTEGFDDLEAYLDGQFSSVRKALEKKIEGNINVESSQNEFKRYLSNLIEAYKQQINQELEESDTEDELTSLDEKTRTDLENIEENLGKALSAFNRYDQRLDDAQKKFIALIDGDSASSDNSDLEKTKRIVNDGIISCKARVIKALEPVLNPLSESDEILKTLDKHVDEILHELTVTVGSLTVNIESDDNTTFETSYTDDAASITDDMRRVSETSLNDESVAAPSEKLTIGQRIKASEARAENLSGDEKLKYILSKLFPSGDEVGDEDLENLTGGGIVGSEELTNAWHGDTEPKPSPQKQPPPPPPRKQPPPPPPRKQPPPPPPPPSRIPIIPKGTVKRATEELLKKGFQPPLPGSKPAKKKEVDNVAETAVLTFLKSYLETLKKHEGPEHPVRAQLVKTIQTMERDFIDKEELPVSPRSVAQGLGASEPAAVEQDVTPEQHLELLNELNEKLAGLLDRYNAQLPEATQEELAKLQNIVQNSMRFVNQQVFKEHTGTVRSTSEPSTDAQLMLTDEDEDDDDDDTLTDNSFGLR